MDRLNFLRYLGGAALFPSLALSQERGNLSAPSSTDSLSTRSSKKSLDSTISDREFDYTLSADRTSGHLYLNTNKLGALNLELKVKLSGFQQFKSLIKTGKPTYRKTASFSYETYSKYTEKIDEGTSEEETYRYGLKDGNWILEKYNGLNQKKKALEGNVLHGQPLVHLISKKYSGEEVDYNMQTFLLGLKYQLKIERKIQNGAFEQISFDPVSSTLLEDGKEILLSEAKKIIFGEITADFNKNIVRMAVAELYNGKTLMIILNSPED